jgi:hypothetical protein
MRCRQLVARALQLRKRRSIDLFHNARALLAQCSLQEIERYLLDGLDRQPRVVRESAASPVPGALHSRGARCLT